MEEGIVRRLERGAISTFKYLLMRITGSYNAVPVVVKTVDTADRNE